MTDGPLICSVVVPVFRDWQEVGKLVQALKVQSIGAERFEVIIVANDEGPRSPITCNLPLLIHEKCLVPGSYAARNVGWKRANSDRIVFTDADCIPEPDWLEEILKVAGQASNALVAGDVKILESPDPSIYSDYDVILGLPQSTYVQRGKAVTANLLVPKKALRYVGGFQENRFSGGDFEFCGAARRSGWTLIFAPQAAVHHPPRATFATHFAKLKRVRGGQISSGTWTRRLKYLFRTSLPPLRRSIVVIRSKHPAAMRIRALFALYILWVAGFAETGRLLLLGKPNR